MATDVVINKVVNQFKSLELTNLKILQSVGRSFQFLLLNKEYNFATEFELFDFNGQISSFFKSLDSNEHTSTVTKLEKYNSLMKSQIEKSSCYSDWFKNLQDVFQGVKRALFKSQNSQIQSLSNLLELQNLNNSNL